MPKRNENRSGERMIHIRLDERTHRELKILAARTDATVQSVVENLIRHRVAEERDENIRINEMRGSK